MTRAAPTRSYSQAFLVWLVLFIGTVSFILAVNKYRIKFDGAFYFSILHSVYFDGDIDFNNEAERDGWIKRSFGKPLPNGLIANPFAVGSAILWSPFYTAADVYCQRFSNSVCDGYSKEYVTAVMTGTVFWTTLGLALTMLSLRALFPATSFGSAVTTVLLMTLASPLIFYLTVDIDYAHANAFAAVSLLLYLTVSFSQKESLAKWQALCYGLAMGMVFSVRWQDIVMWLLAAPVVVKIWGEKKPVLWVLMAVGTLIAALPQLIFWQQLYGSPVTVPQGSGFLTIEHIEALKFLFSTWNGVFYWHPILLLAAAGLLGFAYLTLKTPGAAWRSLSLAAVMIVLLEVILSMMARDWWSGGAFGQRRLVSILPLLCIGLHQLRGWSRQSGPLARISLGILVIALVMWNLLTLLRFHQGKLPLNPADANNYASRQVYAHYDYSRRFTDIWTGRDP